MPTESPTQPGGVGTVTDHAGSPHRGTGHASGSSVGPPVPQPRIAICPYCGEEVGGAAQCAECKGMLDPLSRQASQNAMGPWSLRDASCPFRPAFSFETLRVMIARGRVNTTSILRGPSTRQFWLRAGQVPGVANLLGVCHVCQASATPSETACASCGATFEIETDRQFLGLSPTRLLPGHATPEQVAASSLAAPKTEAPRPPTPTVLSTVHARISPPPPFVPATTVALGTVPANSSTQTLNPATTPARSNQVSRAWKRAAVALTLLCISLIGTLVVAIVMLPGVLKAVRAVINTNE